MDKNLKVIKKVNGIIGGATEGEVLDVRSEVLNALGSSGMQMSDIYGVLKDGLSAVRKRTSSYGEDEIEIDYGVRHKYMVTALELLGHLRKDVKGSVDKELIEEEVMSAILDKVRDEAKRLGAIDV